MHDKANNIMMLVMLQYSRFMAQIGPAQVLMLYHKTDWQVEI